MIDELWRAGPALLAGLLLGGIFFGGLWWTIRRAMPSRWVALWFMLSLLVRVGLVVGGFYFVCGDDWRRWLAALTGFVAARLLVARLTRGCPVPEVGHAS